ncbi:MAG: MOSC N-terminal beta barrel domain-containing protein, partial [Pseudomonadota bacterium]
MITHLYRYPVKGLSAEALQDMSLTVENGLAGDRAIAIARQSDVFDPAAPKAVSKFHFLMLAKDEALAKLRTAYDEETGYLTLSQDGDIKLTAPVNTA